MKVMLGKLISPSTFTVASLPGPILHLWTTKCVAAEVPRRGWPSVLSLPAWPLLASLGLTDGEPSESYSPASPFQVQMWLGLNAPHGSVAFPPTVSWGTPVILLTPQVDEANARLCPSEKLKGKRSLTVVGCSHSTCFGAAECGAECGDAGFLDCLPSESHNAGMWKSKAFHDWVGLAQGLCTWAGKWLMTGWRQVSSWGPSVRGYCVTPSFLGHLPGLSVVPVAFLIMSDKLLHFIQL